MAFEKTTCAWVPPALLPLAAVSVVSYMDSTELPALSEVEILDDRGGTGCFQIRSRNISVKQMKKIMPKAVHVTSEDY